MDNIDERLLEHWQRERTARELARAALPTSWRNDTRPKMHEVREKYLEAIHSFRLAAVVDDDR